MVEVPSDSGPNRRSVIKAALNTGIMASVASLAGCGSSGDGGDGGDGGDVEHGEIVREMTFEVLAETEWPQRFESCRITTQAWNELGFRINMVGVETGALVNTLVEHNWEDMMAMWWGPNPDRLDPNTIPSMWHSENTNRAYWNWNNDEYDQLIEEQRAATDQSERQEIVHELQEVWHDDFPGGGLYYGNRVNAYNNERINSVNVLQGEGLDSIWTRCYAELADGVTTNRVDGSSFPFNFNPIALTGDVNNNTLNKIYDPLVRIDTDLSIREWAGEFEWVDDTTITFDIRDDMTFHDGEPVTAEDVVFTYETTMEVGGLHQSTAQNSIESIESASEYEVTFNLTQPFAPIHYALFSQVLIIPQHIWADIDDKLGHPNQEPIGSGPMEFNAFIPDQELSITAYPDHFQPATVPEELRIAHEDKAAIYRAIEEGELDMGMGPAPPFETQERMRELDFVTVVDEEAPGNGFTLYRMDESPFDDLAVREALQRARPARDAIDIGYGGNAATTHGPVSQVLDFWFNDDLEWPADDMEGARAVLEEAGYTWDDDGNLHHPA